MRNQPLYQYELVLFIIRRVLVHQLGYGRVNSYQLTSYNNFLTNQIASKLTQGCMSFSQIDLLGIPRWLKCAEIYFVWVFSWNSFSKIGKVSQEHILYLDMALVQLVLCFYYVLKALGLQLRIWFRLLTDQPKDQDNESAKMGPVATL